jgi:outer membrane lipoprotein-sorting protein
VTRQQIVRLPRTLACTAAALGALVTVTFPAIAAGDPVPLPHLRPSHNGAPAATSTDAAAGAVRPLAQQAYDPNSPFSPAQQVALANISAYFNSFSLMEGDFVQIGPNGEQSEGVFFLHRPGKIRFHYNPPTRLDVISDGSTVAIKDGRSGTQDMYPLSKTPLRYLLAERVDLTRLADDVREETDLISVRIHEKSSFAEGTLTMTFDRKSYELRQWQVTDAQGLNTSVAIFNTVTGKPQDPNLFRVQVN